MNFRVLGPSPWLLEMLWQANRPACGRAGHWRLRPAQHGRWGANGTPAASQDRHRRQLARCRAGGHHAWGHTATHRQQTQKEQAEQRMGPGSLKVLGSLSLAVCGTRMTQAGNSCIPLSFHLPFTRSPGSVALCSVAGRRPLRLRTRRQSMRSFCLTVDRTPLTVRWCFF